MSRASKLTYKTKTPILYSDFTNNFELNPLSGALAVVTNEQAIIQSFKNIILTNKAEGLYAPLKGTKIRNKLFDMMDTGQEDSIEQMIREAARNDIPRVNIIDIQVDSLIDKNSLSISITVECVNLPNIFNFNIILERVR